MTQLSHEELEQKCHDLFELVLDSEDFEETKKLMHEIHQLAAELHDDTAIKLFAAMYIAEHPEEAEKVEEIVEQIEHIEE